MTDLKKLLCFIMFFLLLTACRGSEAQPEPENRDSPTATFVAPSTTAEAPALEPAATAVPPSATPEPQIEATEIRLTATAEIQPTADSGEEITPFVEDVIIIGAGELPIHGTLTVPGGAGPHPGVVLLHMLGDNRLVWLQTGFSQALQQNGIASLAVDIRGHGETGSDQDWALAEIDLQNVVNYLSQRPEIESVTAVVGASIGSNMALITAANMPDIQTAVLLSPGLDYRGVTTDDRLEDYGERPLLIIASTGDTYAAQSSQTLHDLALGDAELIVYDGSAHGTNIFAAQPELSQTIIDWLKKYQ